MTNPYAPPRAAVLDIVDPNAQFVLADRGTRLGAAILDGLVMLPIYLPLVFSLALGGNGQGRLDETTGPAFALAGLVLMFVGFIVWTWFTILYVSRNGQTIAKKFLGIKVVRSDGSPATLGRIFLLRNVVNALLGIIPLYGLIDHLCIFGDSRQCLHDRIADTMVVKA